jgi:hypothetical protein
MGHEDEHLSFFLFLCLTAANNNMGHDDEHLINLLLAFYLTNPTAK